MRQMAVNLAGVELKNPVMTASGSTRSAYRIRGMIYLHRGISRFYVSMIRRLSSMYVEKRRKITLM